MTTGRRITRLLAAAGIAAGLLATVAPAGAQDGYTGGWTDPAPSREQDGKPVAYLDFPRPLVGQVSHPNGIESVNVVLVSGGAGDGCAAQGEADPNAADGTGQSVTFRFSATFPCNDIYEVRATAHAARGSGLADGTPPPYSMPLLVAVAFPPLPVSEVEAVLTVDGDDRDVVLEWPANDESDLLGYVVARVVDGDRESLGQVDAGDVTEIVDHDPPAGKTATYEVTSVRRGPDEEVPQVSAAPTVVTVDVPPEPDPVDESDGAGSDDGEPPLTSAATAPPQSASEPTPGGLSSVRTRGVAAPPQGPPTTIDTGFGETLPFVAPEPGEVAAPPTGDPAVVAEFEFDEGGSPLENRETMALIAGGLALFVGALVIVYVTRRAAALQY